MKNGFINMCGTQYSDLLDTTYYDVVEDIIGSGFGCSESTPLEPLLGKIFSYFLAFKVLGIRRVE